MSRSSNGPQPESGGRGDSTPLSRPDARWFPLWQPTLQVRARLVCLPGAGSGASMFRQWRRLLPDVEILAVQLPGREHRVNESPSRDFETLVRDLAAVVAALPPRGQPALPVAVFGHSLGALLGFALCRALSATQPPARLIVAGGRAAHLPASRILSNLPQARLFEELLKIGGTSPELLAEPEWVALIEPVLRADLFLGESNRLAATPPLPLPISVFAGANDSQVRPDELEGWRLLSSVDCTIEHLPGGHFFVLEQAAEVARRVRALLA